jgi:hypothetical protein
MCANRSSKKYASFVILLKNVNESLYLVCFVAITEEPLI